MNRLFSILRQSNRPGSHSGGIGYRRVGIVVLVALLLVAPQFSYAQTAQELSYRVKAACLFNFLQFIEWPADAFAASDTPIVIGVYGEDPFKGALNEIVVGERVSGRPIQIRRLESISDAQSCQLIFLPRAEGPAHKKDLSELSRNHVLTVGEADGFAELGGGINFTNSGGKVRFEINTVVIKTANLRVSSKLLRLARLVTTTGGIE